MKARLLPVIGLVVPVLLLLPAAPARTVQSGLCDDPLWTSDGTLPNGPPVAFECAQLSVRAHVESCAFVFIETRLDCDLVWNVDGVSKALVLEPQGRTTVKDYGPRLDWGGFPPETRDCMRSTPLDSCILSTPPRIYPPRWPCSPTDPDAGCFQSFRIPMGGQSLRWCHPGAQLEVQGPMGILTLSSGPVCIRGFLDAGETEPRLLESSN